MADAKISELTAIDAVTGVDLLAVVDDPAGTPATKKATATQLKDFVVGAGSVSVASGKTLTASNTLTLAGTDSTTMTFPSTSATIARTDAANSFTGSQTLESTAELLWSTDLRLTRRGAANLRLGAADAASPVAQTLSVQSVVAGTSNTAGANLTITGSQGTGTGAGGSIIFQVAPAGTTGTAQNALATALTIDSASVSTFAGRIIAPAGSAGAPSYTNTGNLTTGWYNDGFLNISVSGVNTASFRSADLWLKQETLIIGASNHAYVVRDAANTLALRNGTNAQTFNIYNTFTSSTSFERLRIVAQSAAAVLIGTEKGSGGGTARALELQTDGTTRLTIAATTGNITTTGSVTTEAPTGGTAAAWRLGTVATVSPTSPNRTIEVDIGGTIYYISAKTTND